MAQPRYKSGPKKGQFKPKSKPRKKVGSKKRKAAKSTTSRKKGKRSMAKKRKRRGVRRGKVMKGGDKARILLSTAVVGYLKEQTKFGPELVSMLKKVPGADSIGTDALLAIVLHYMAKNIRTGRKYTDAASVGLCGAIGLKLGQSGFDSKAILSGPGDWGEADELLGSIDPSDFLEPESIVS